MSDASALISPVDVAVCDPDVLWRVSSMNAIKGVNVREYGAPSDGLEVATPGHPMVLVVGPTNPPDELEAVRRSPLHGKGVRVLVVDHGPAESQDQRAEALGVEAVVAAEAGEEAFAAAVLALRARSDVPGEDLRADALPTAAPAEGSAPAATEPPVDAEPEAAPRPGATDEADPTTTERPATTGPESLPAGVIVISSAKGGEGSSTLALNLALALTGRSGQVALVDGDPHYGDLALDLGLEPPRPAVSDDVGDDLLAEARKPTAGSPDEADDLPVTEGPSGLLLVQAPRPPEGEPRDAADDAAVLQAVVTIAARRADVVVVDLPIDALVASPAFHRAAAIVIVTTGHTASIKNALLTAERLDFAPTAGLVLNEISRYPSPAAPDEIAARVGLPLIAHLPYDHALDRAGSTPERRLVAGSHSHYTHAVGDLARTLAKRVAAGAPG